MSDNWKRISVWRALVGKRRAMTPAKRRELLSMSAIVTSHRKAQEWPR